MDSIKSPYLDAEALEFEVLDEESGDFTKQLNSPFLTHEFSVEDDLDELEHFDEDELEDELEDESAEMEEIQNLEEEDNILDAFEAYQEDESEREIIQYEDNSKTDYGLFEEEFINEQVEDEYYDNYEEIEDYSNQDDELHSEAAALDEYDEEFEEIEDDTEIESIKNENDIWGQDIDEELNEWESLEEDELEEDLIGFGFLKREFISNVTFQNDVSIPTTSGPELPGQEYYDPNGSSNPLLDTSAKNRKKKLSKNFSVDELAQSSSGQYRFNKSRIDPELVEYLQKLSDFLGNKSIKVIDGYYSYKHLKNLARRRKLKSIPNSPHLSGQGTKIVVRGMSGTQLAKAIVIACDNDVSISIGTSSAAIYVRQTTNKITSYIGNKTKRRSARSYIEKFRDLIHKKPAFLEKELQSKYKTLKIFLRSKIRNINNSPDYPWNILIKAALSLRLDMGANDPELVTEVLYYTKFSNVLKHYYYLDKKKSFELLDFYNELKCIKRYRNDNTYNWYTADDDDLAFWYYNPMNNRQYWEIIRYSVVAPIFDLPAPPSSQRRPLDKGSKDKRVLAISVPDRPTVSITGKYERIFSNENKKHAGEILCINQAGNHVEGILSLVNRARGNDDNVKRTFLQVYGDLKSNGTFQMFYRGEIYVNASRGDWTITPKKNGKNLKLTYDKHYTVFKQTTTQPTMLSHAIAAFPVSEQKIVRAHEWFPLLSIQINKLKEELNDNINLLENKIKKALDTGTKNDERTNQKTAARELDSYIGNIFTKSDIHYSDKERARFYLTSRLVQKKLKVDGRRTQSLLDWIQFVIESLHQHSQVELNNIKEYLGLKLLGKKYGQKKHQYKVSIDIYGVSFFVGAYHGSLKIEKLKGTGQTWKQTFDVTFGSAGVSLTEVKKLVSLDFSKSIAAIGESYLEWQPHDVPGWIKIGEGTAGVGPIGVGAGFIHIDGADYMPMMEAFFADGPKWKSPISVGIDKSGLKIDSPYKNLKPDLGFGGFVGRIHKKNLPNVDYSNAEVQKEFLANYHYKNEVHFALGSALLTAPAKQAIRIMCAQELVALSNSGSKLEIIAHTDRVDTEKRNLVLSALRAANTRQAIEDVLGKKLKAKFVEVSGKGEQEAKGMSGPDENPKYRRVDVFLDSRIILRLSTN